ncbi:MAG: twin-arginine translocase subunit TatC, partial [Chloroflexi bacterium]|nr:twin-arginine translocase subunit TatC [Chloroflexota bacterium]
MPDQAMPVVGHLAELRRRVFICLIALIAGVAVSFVFYKQIIRVLERAGGHPHLYIFTLTGAIGPVMKIALLGGVIVSLPVWVYQIVAFIAPGLTRKERRYLFMLLPAVTFCFVGGVAFAYFVLIPPMVDFLLTFGNDVATPQPSLQSYIDTVTMLMFWMGVAFETPFLMYFLALIHIVKPSFYSRFRKYWFVI